MGSEVTNPLLRRCNSSGKGTTEIAVLKNGRRHVAANHELAVEKMKRDLRRGSTFFWPHAVLARKSRSWNSCARARRRGPTRQRRRNLTNLSKGSSERPPRPEAQLRGLILRCRWGFYTSTVHYCQQRKLSSLASGKTAKVWRLRQVCDALAESHSQ